MTAEADEHLRQEREAFEVNKAQTGQWFALQVRTGYAGLIVNDPASLNYSSAGPAS